MRRVLWLTDVRRAMSATFACLWFALMIESQLVMADQQASAIDVAVEWIDRAFERDWQRRGIEPAPMCDDETFCRRVWLDLAGIAPPVSQVRRFLDDSRADKRDRLVDRVLRSAHHARHMANRWNRILLPADIQAQPQQRANAAALHEWLRVQFRNNVRYDYLVGSFLTAGGPGNSGPAIFYTSYDLQPEKLAAATSRIFLGLQLQCAQCHDHPFDRWTQQDFWHYAAFFSQVQRSSAARANTVIIEDRIGAEVRLPDSDQIMLPMYPGVRDAPEDDPTGMRRRQLTIWLASRDNPYFARAAVNRAWAHLMGRGLVDPVDAMNESNRPSHPEVLDYLSRFFTKQRFDLRMLYATLARTRIYGLSSDVVPPAPSDSFAAMPVKTLTADQFVDSLFVNVRMVYPSALGSADPMVMSQGIEAERQGMIDRMRESSESPLDYPHGVVQVLALMNGPEIQVATDPARSGLIQSLQAPFFDDRQRIETMFLATLTRRPSPEELSRFQEILAESTNSQDRMMAWQDMLWVLVNTAEFAVCP